MYWQLSRPNKKSGNLGYSLPSLFPGLFPRKRKPIRQWSMKHLGNKAGQLKLAGKLPQFGIDRLDLLHVRPGPPPMLRVRCYCPRLAFRCPWPGALAAVQLASGSTSNGGVLTHPAGPGLCTAPAPRPIGTKTGCIARFDKSCVVNFFHYSPPPLVGSGVHQFRPGSV